MVTVTLALAVAEALAVIILSVVASVLLIVVVLGAKMASVAVSCGVVELVDVTLEFVSVDIWVAAPVVSACEPEINKCDFRLKYTI